MGKYKALCIAIKTAIKRTEKLTFFVGMILAAFTDTDIARRKVVRPLCRIS